MEEEVKVVSFKKKKTSYNPYKVSAIVVIGVLVLVFIMNLYASKNRDYLWLKCNYNTERTDYKETVSFKFLKKQDGVLYEYYRDETYTYEDEKEFDAVYEYLTDYKDSLGVTLGGDNIQYLIKKVDNHNIKVNTYINVGTYGSVFDAYIKAFDLNKESTIEEIYNTLSANQTYSCTVTESK